MIKKCSIILLIFTFVSCDFSDYARIAQSDDVSYCFRMTWIGPKYNNDSKIANVTCESLLNDLPGLPCKLPLAATYDGSLPNMTALWDEYKDKKPQNVACRLVQGETCIKYIYKFNDAVENITYMCAKAFEDGGAALTSGCYTQTSNGRETEVCLCKTASHASYPCNNANVPQSNSVVLPMLLLISLTATCFLRYSKIELG